MARDVTELKAMEHQLHQSEVSFRAIADYTADAEIWLDPHGYPRWINPATGAMTGLDLEQCMSMYLFPLPLAAETDRGKLAAALEAALQGGQGNDLPFRLYPADGRRRWASASWQMIRDEQGVNLGVRISLRDITQRKRQERRLRRNNRRLRQAQQAGRIGCWEIDLLTGRQWWSRQASELVGMDPDQPPPSFHEDGPPYSPQEWQRIRAAQQRTIETGEPARLQLSVQMPDGSMRYQLVRGEVHRDRSGRVRWVSGTTQDITQERHDRMRLRRTQAFYRALFEQNPAIKLLVDPADGRIIRANRAAESFFAAQRHQLKALTLYDLSTTEAGAVHSAMQLAVADKPLSFEMVARLVSGEQRDVEVHAGPVQWNGRTILFCIIHDVTRRKELEHAAAVEQERERQEHQSAMRSLESLLGVVAHELRTPLSAVRVIAELMMQSAETNGEHGENLNRIHQEVVRMSDLVNDLLETARQQGDNSRWRWRSFALKPLVEECLDCIRPLLDPGRVALDAWIEPEDMAMQGDRDSIRRLLINLLSNAAQHTGDGLIQLVVEKEETEQADGMDQIRFVVHDTGEGIAPEHLPLLAKPFAINSARIGDGFGKSTGLGLTICRGIVAAHGGRMMVSTQPGSGTSFTVLVPAATPGPQNREIEIEINEELDTV